MLGDVRWCAASLLNDIAAKERRFPYLQNGESVLVIAHGNSLRLVKK